MKGILGKARQMANEIGPNTKVGLSTVVTVGVVIATGLLQYGAMRSEVASIRNEITTITARVGKLEDKGSSALGTHVEIDAMRDGSVVARIDRLEVVLLALQDSDKENQISHQRIINELDKVRLLLEKRQ